jgi:hypothetical protein
MQIVPRIELIGAGHVHAAATSDGDVPERAWADSSDDMDVPRARGTEW